MVPQLIHDCPFKYKLLKIYDFYDGFLSCRELFEMRNVKV